MQVLWQSHRVIQMVDVSQNTILLVNKQIQEGKLADATKTCKKGLEKSPDNPEWLGMLGVIALQKQDPESAVSYFQKALEHRKDKPVAATHVHLAKAFIQLKNLQKTSEHLKLAMETLPSNDMLAKPLLATISRHALSIQQYALSQRCYEKYLLIDPTSHSAHSDLAKVIIQAERSKPKIEGSEFADKKLTEKAIHHLEQSNRYGGNKVENMVLIADAKLSIGRYFEARLLLDKLEKEGYRSWKSSFLLGKCNEFMGHLQEALNHYLVAESLSDDIKLPVLSRIIMLQERMNKLDEAQETASKILHTAPGHPETLFILSKIERRKGNTDKAIQLLESLDLSSYKAMYSAVQFELGKLYQKKKDFSQAYACFTKGKRFVPEPKTQKVDEVIEGYKGYFTKEKCLRWQSIHADGIEQIPTFLIGFPRSGTTLMEQILSSHDKVLATQESPIIKSIALSFLPRLLDIQDHNITYPQLLDHIDPSRISSIQQCYFQVASRYLNQSIENLLSSHLVDKNPLNISFLGAINCFFPKAKILMMLRDPRDVVVSCFSQNFRAVELASNVKTLESAAMFYHKIMNYYLHIKSLVSLDILEIRYESLVQDARPLTQNALTLMGLPWDESVLSFYQKDKNRFVTTPSNEGIAQKLYSSSIGKWKHYEEYLAPYLPILEPYVKAFGYDEA